MGIVPDSLKVAKVIPFHQGGMKGDTCMSNYRPISTLLENKCNLEPFLSRI